MKNSTLLLSLVSIAFLSCNDPKNDQAETNDEVSEDSSAFSELESLSNHYTLHASSKVISSISNSIHSPLEFTDQLIQSGAEYSQEIPGKIIDKSYSTKEHQSLISGICAADLCYMYQYQQKNMVSDYYNKFLELSKTLEFYDHLNQDLVKNLSNSNGDINLLSATIRNEFTDLHKKLESLGRSDISILMLIGTWIESTHIYFETYEQNHSTKIHDIIGEQKIVLNKLIILLSNYGNNPFISQFKEKLSQLLDKFSVVKIEYTHDTLMEASSKEEFLEMESKSRKITVSDEDIYDIRSAFEDLRNEIING